MPDPYVDRGDVTFTRAVPARAEAFAMVAAGAVAEDVGKGRVTYVLVMTMSGAKGRRWHLHHVDPVAVDDVIRAIARSERCAGVAAVLWAPVPPECEGVERCYRVIAEGPDGVAEVILGLRGGTAPGGEEMRMFRKSLDPRKPKWLGVPPEGEVSMWYQGIAGIKPPEDEQ